MLTSVGPGTAAGQMLRCYWLPVARAEDVTDSPIAVSALGEKLVLFRFPDGTPALLQERCPHRGTSLIGGRIERGGLRCCYHGWLFDGTGQCLEQPGEPGAGFAQKVRITAYPALDRHGLIWAYLGVGDPPALPPLDVHVRADGYRVVTEADWDCNYFQVIENQVDPMHTNVLHQDTELEDTYAPIPDISFNTTTFGINTVAERPGYHREAEMVFPSCIRFELPFMDPPLQSNFWVLPRNDVSARSFHTWFVPYPKGADEAEKARIRAAVEKFVYRGDPCNRRHHSTTVVAQDQFACVSQGTLVDRSQEWLGSTDRGVILLRQLYLEAIEAVENGRDPLGILRETPDIIAFENVK